MHFHYIWFVISISISDEFFFREFERIKLFVSFRFVFFSLFFLPFFIFYLILWNFRIFDKFVIFEHLLFLIFLVFSLISAVLILTYIFSYELKEKFFFLKKLYNKINFLYLSNDVQIKDFIIIIKKEVYLYNLFTLLHYFGTFIVEIDK